MSNFLTHNIYILENRDNIMRVVIPVAGGGTRLQPHTFVTSKALIPVAGRPILDYVLEDVAKLKPNKVTLVVGHHKEKIIEHVQKNSHGFDCEFVEQVKRDGDGSAVRIGLEDMLSDAEFLSLSESEQEALNEELYIVFGADTLIDFDIKADLENVRKKGLDAAIFAMQVDSPTHYGVLNINQMNEVYEVEEKPKDPKSNLAIIGAYYFKSARDVKFWLDHFHKNGITDEPSGEYKLVQVIKKYVEDSGLSVQPVEVKKWFDCGREEVLHAANRYFLNKFYPGNGPILRGDSVLIPPYFIPSDVELHRCVIGPNVSIGAGSKLTDVNINNSIIGERCELKNKQYTESVIGKEVSLMGKPKKVSFTDKSFSSDE